jgi:hypothetical protein
VHWKLKSMIQNTVSLLPSAASYAGYYWLQRHFGRLRRIDPVSGLSAGIETWKRIKEQGCDPLEKVFLEIGTGRVPLVPLSYWLMGAKKTVTIDLNPYLKGDLIGESLRYISDNGPAIQGLFGPLLDKKRLDDLVIFSGNANFSTRAFLALCKIEYIAPGNAANTGLPIRSIDFHTSYTVFEHVSPEVLTQILEEGIRIISNDGLFIHHIDYTDHFSHTDPNISAINFLQYSDDEWVRYAGNRYMYSNRLRHDDFVSLFQSAGHRILHAQVYVDRRSQELLRSGSLQLNERFRTKSEETLSISASWIVSKKNG